MLNDPNWRGMGEFAPLHRLSSVQKVRNVEWPPDRIARFVPRHRRVPVEARVEFDADGEVWLPGSAIRWIRPVVFVQIDDRRIEGAGLWLPARDVRRSAGR